ncbi:MAG: sugar ABC transporter permease [Clostridiales bacterium]|nr:sugar ABC transporter permease [Clostridiales bacterium]
MLTHKQKRNLPLHLMIIPGALVILIFSYGPMMGLVMVFQKFSAGKGFFRSPFVGLENFRYVFSYPGIWQVLSNTLLISSLKIIGSIVFPVLVALLLNELSGRRFKRVVQTAIYFPHFLSWIILGGLMIDILSPSEGLINGIIGAVGGTPVYFLGDKNWFPYTMVITELWKEVGYGTIVYMAALTAIDPTLYEAAAIDGAGHWKQMRHVTLPSLMPTILLMAMLSLGAILNAGGTLSAAGSSGFEQIFNLYSPQVYETGDVLDTLVFRLGLGGTKYSVAATIGFLKSIVSGTMMVLGYWIAKKVAHYEII